MSVIIQGDNKTIIEYWSGRTRINDPQMQMIFEPLVRAMKRTNIKIQWKYIPREHNAVADRLANAAADAVADGSYVGRVDLMGAIIMPAEGDLRSPFDGHSEEWDQQAAIRYTRAIAVKERPENPLVLHEEYKIDHRVLNGDIPDADLVTIIGFLRQRKMKAKYEQAAGHEAVSRHYCKEGGIVRGGINKRVRYLMLSDHYEMDIVSCFHAIMRAGARECHNPLLDKTEESIKYIEGNVRPRGQAGKMAKVLLQRIVTAAPEVVRSQMENEFGVQLTPELYWQMRRFYDCHRNIICKRLNDMGYVGQGNQQKITQANKLYFACEAAETMIMVCTLRKVLEQNTVRSVVWLHDGMYIHNGVGREGVARAFKEAAEEAGVPEAEVKFTDCCEFNQIAKAEVNSGLRDSLMTEIKRLYERAGNEVEAEVDLDKPLGRLKTIFNKG